MLARLEHIIRWVKRSSIISKEQNMVLNKLFYPKTIKAGKT